MQRDSRNCNSVCGEEDMEAIKKYRYTFQTKCEEVLGANLEDLAGSKKEFHDPYVERLQKFIDEVKLNRG